MEHHFKRNRHERERYVINFPTFINAIIKRRNRNVAKWLEKITKDFPNLKKIYFDSDLDDISPLNKIWVICDRKCKSCYNKCYLLNGHKLEDKCFYNHKCEEKCQICFKINCNEKCALPMSHPEIHSCNRFHRCLEDCCLKKNTKNCKGRCILNYGHTEQHTCGEIHYCNGICSLFEKARKCNHDCRLEYPHENEEHSCGQKHYCNEVCYLKENSKGGDEICIKEYGHSEEHICNEKHFCKGECYLKDKAAGCSGKCNLDFPHPGQEHDCEQIHLCKNICEYKDRSIGCKGFCSKGIYNHIGNHFCGEKHYCKEKCYGAGEAGNCGGICKLEFPHAENINHNCGQEHKCIQKCFYKEKSKFCKNICSLKYKHEGKCICEFDENKHICNKKCQISNNCGKDCILKANHSGLYLCGECKCPYDCKYKNCTRGCNQKCKYNSGHEEKGEKEHICNANTHYCKGICIYKNISKNCEVYCTNEYGKCENNHICNKSKLSHDCIGKCIHYGKARNCKENCNLEVGHKGDHRCFNYKNHLCNEKCDLKSISRNCENICEQQYGHAGNHICNINKENHICNKKCSLKSYSREGCEEECNLSAGHKGKCFCKNNEKKHICNGLCHLKDKANGCFIHCIKESNHLGEHICKNKIEEHFCKGECFLFKNPREFKGIKCGILCSFKYNHKGKCLCSEQAHPCIEPCCLKNKSRECRGLCEIHFFSFNINPEDIHKCKGNHFCKNLCFYYNLPLSDKIRHKIRCNQFCGKEYDHEGICICQKPHFHPCDKICSLHGISRGCDEECSKEYGHEGKCLCIYKPEKHTCKELCQLCLLSGIEKECGHVYNHQNTKDLKCSNCRDDICKLSGKGHLCGFTHECIENCEENGYCDIESFVKQEEQEDKELTTNLGQTIHYKSVKLQKKIKKKCTEKILPNEFNHSKKHSCKSSNHKCGFQCKQCEYYCIEPIGHEGSHFCYHGNIKASTIHITDEKENNARAIVKMEEKNIELTEGEEAKMFICDSYCKNQGQGHIHIFESNIKIDNEEVRLYKTKNYSFLYECKCSYFWENILKFKSQLITQQDKKLFSLCNWKCKYSIHQIPEYCQLPLWHVPVKEMPKGPGGNLGEWISRGHVLKCKHDIGIYTIFLIDSSGSMNSNTHVPSNNYIWEKRPNMIGAAIQAIYSYCEIREKSSPKDKCALFGFNKQAFMVFENFGVEERDKILNKCFGGLKPNGFTLFEDAFVKAFDLINNQNFDRNEFIPIIILLTDGLDHGHEKTIPFIEEVSNIIIFIFIFI